MPDDDWTLGSLAAQDQYGGFPLSENVEDRRPTSLYEFSAREPVIVPGYMPPARGWGDIVEQGMIRGNPGPDRTFGYDPHGFKAAIEYNQQFPDPPMHHPTQGDPRDNFEGELERLEFMDQMRRSLDKAMRDYKGPLFERGN